jgi:hypothetical protein
MKQADHDREVLAAHRTYADALAAVDHAAAELATAKAFLESAEGRLRQLARVEVDE